MPCPGAAALQLARVLAAEPEDIKVEQQPEGPQPAAAMMLASAMLSKPANIKLPSEEGDTLPVRATASLRAIVGAVSKAARPQSGRRRSLLPGTGRHSLLTASHARPVAATPAGAGASPLCGEIETSSIASPASSESLSIASASSEEDWLAEAQSSASKVTKTAKPPARATGAKQPAGEVCKAAGRTPAATLARYEQHSAAAGAAAASRTAAVASLLGSPVPRAGHQAAGPTLQNDVQGSSMPRPVAPSCSALAVTKGQETALAAHRGQDHTLRGKQAGTAHVPRASEHTGSKGDGIQPVPAAGWQAPKFPKQACPEKPSKPAKGILKVHWYMPYNRRAAYRLPSPGMLSHDVHGVQGRGFACGGNLHAAAFVCSCQHASLDRRHAATFAPRLPAGG